jgi:hypothetical protein
LIRPASPWATWDDPFGAIIDKRSFNDSADSFAQYDDDSGASRELPEDADFDAFGSTQAFASADGSGSGSGASGSFGGP